MQNYLYSKEEDIEVSFSSKKRDVLIIKSEIKNITFDLSIVKFETINSLIEKVTEREVFSSKFLEEKAFLFSKIDPFSNSQNRVELHLRIYDPYLSSRYFYFDLGSTWEGGGLFFVRSLKE